MSEPRNLADFPGLSREDTISVTISPAASPDDVEFVLETAPEVTWWKAIELRSADGAMTAQRETQDSDHGPHSFSAHADDLVGSRLTLAKAKIFGIHTGMYELQNLSGQRGSRIHFLWQRDDDQDGAVIGFFRDLGRAIAGAADAVADAVVTVVHAVGEWLGGIISGIGNFIAGLLDGIGSLLGNIPLIGPLLRGIFHWVATIVSAAFEFVATLVRGVLDIVANVVAGLIRMIVGGIGGLIAWDGRTFVKGFGGLVAGIVGGVVAIFGTLLALIHAVLFMQWGERPLNQMESALLRRVYRESVALDNVRIIEGFAGFFSLNPRPFTLGNRIYMKAFDPATNLDTLVHECCHVWQNQHEGTRYVADALWAQAAVTDAYNWELEISRGHSRFQDFNKEAQGAFIQAVFNEGRHVPTPGMSGEFFDDDPIGANVTFRGTAELTGLARETMLYVRGA
jgi:hypothetical protein